MSFSFGTPSSAPANTGLSGGFNFAAKPATPGFGLTATTQASTGLFGTPATSAPAFGSTGFGATTTPKFGTTPTLGATPAFGTTPALGSTPAFGTTPALGSTPTFGTTPALGTAFGTTPALGTTPAFGTTPALGTTPAFGTTSTAPTFGTGAPAFGATTTSAFGTTNTLGTGLGGGGLGGTGLGGGGLGGGGLGGGLNFGTGSTLSAPSTGLNLGTTSVTGTQPTTLVTPSLGLGGVAATTTGIGAANATDAKTEPPKQTKLPNEISTTVDSFKEFVKKQKSLSSEVMRVSIKPLHKVSREAESTLRLALSLSGEVNKARAQARRLRAGAAAALAAADGAARDHHTPGLELESPAPPPYVKDLVAELEQQLITFRRQMDVADKQMQAEPKLLTEQELTLGIRRMHESLVALAGRLQTVHSQVEAQKEQYLNLRKYVLKDPSNVFETRSYSTSLDQILKDAESSKKKTKTSHFGQSSDVSYGSAVLSDPRAALGNIQQLAGPTPFNYVANTISTFPTADTSGPGWQPAAAPAPPSFQLQKPPGKRGKQ